MARILRRTAALVLATSLLAVLSVGPALAASPVIHFVSAGGADADFYNHSDSNFSLVARQYADGRVTGQYTDRTKNLGGFHAIIDCLVVDGNDAWVSGVITSGTFFGQDLTGFPVLTQIRDNGTSRNDPADQISFSWWPEPTPCTDRPELPLFDMTNGQVVVR